MVLMVRWPFFRGKKPGKKGASGPPTPLG